MQINKSVAILFVTALIFSSSSASAADTARAPVVVELFTSQGCSSCPPADHYLSTLTETFKSGPKVVVVSEHVDYWDHLGWKDPFSSKIFTDRQQSYAKAFKQNTVYTPEMVVDGRTGFGGTDSRSAVEAINSRTNEPKLNIGLTAVCDSIHKIVNVSLNTAVSLGRDEQLVVFLTQDNVTVSVRTGENSGRVLKHTGVARVVKLFEKPVKKFSLPLPADAGIASIKVVVLRQDTKSMAVTGVGLAGVITSK